MRRRERRGPRRQLPRQQLRRSLRIRLLGSLAPCRRGRSPASTGRRASASEELAAISIMPAFRLRKSGASFVSRRGTAPRSALVQEAAQTPTRTIIGKTTEHDVSRLRTQAKPAKEQKEEARVRKVRPRAKQGGPTTARTATTQRRAWISLAPLPLAVARRHFLRIALLWTVGPMCGSNT